jgi:hypothetical protein
MSIKNEADSAQMWRCTKYGVAMLAAYAAAFCARRFAAANQKDAARISFGRCRECSRGAAAYKLARRKGTDMPDNRMTSSRG